LLVSSHVSPEYTFEEMNELQNLSPLLRNFPFILGKRNFELREFTGISIDAYRKNLSSNALYSKSFALDCGLEAPHLSTVGMRFGSSTESCVIIDYQLIDVVLCQDVSALQHEHVAPPGHPGPLVEVLDVHPY